MNVWFDKSPILLQIFKGTNAAFTARPSVVIAKFPGNVNFLGSNTSLNATFVQQFKNSSQGDSPEPSGISMYGMAGYGGSCGIPLLKHFFSNMRYWHEFVLLSFSLRNCRGDGEKQTHFFSFKNLYSFFLFPACRDVRHCFWLLRQTSISAEMSTGKKGSLKMNLRPTWFLKNVCLRSTSTMTWPSWKCILDGIWTELFKVCIYVGGACRWSFFSWVNAKYSILLFCKCGNTEWNYHFLQNLIRISMYLISC